MSTQKTTNKSLIKALDILGCFITCDELGVTEISKRLKLPKSTAHNLISTLENKGLVEQNPENSKYRLGIKIFELGMRWSTGRDIKTVALRRMQLCADVLGEIVMLTILSGDQALIIHRADPPVPFLLVPRLGYNLPLHSTASGKVLLANTGKGLLEDVIKRLALEKYTATTITDPGRLRQSLQKIRKDGYAMDEGETFNGTICCAAPIYDYSNTIMGSVSVMTSADRFPTKRHAELIETVKTLAEKISYDLGYQVVKPA
jgi:IclR family transcriptional regulator, KDG regulon repressor